MKSKTKQNQKIRLNTKYFYRTLTWFSRSRPTKESRNLMMLSHLLTGVCWGTPVGDLDDFPTCARAVLGALESQERTSLEYHKPKQKSSFPNDNSKSEAR